MTHKNVKNFQTSLNLQQTYSAALGSHINNIYHKILEIQQQLPHPTQHMNTGDVIQIDAPDFDPDIDGGLPTKEHKETQGSDSFIQHLSGESDKSKALALPQQVAEEVDWPDAVPVEILPQSDQDNDHNMRVSPTQYKTNLSEIPQLESDARSFILHLYGVVLNVFIAFAIVPKVLISLVVHKYISCGFGECCESVP